MEAKFARLALVDADPDNVGRQEVAGELDTLELEVEGGGQRMRQRGLADARHIFKQKVATCDEAGESQLHLAWLAQQNAVDLGQGGIEPVAQHFIVEWSRRGHDRCVCPLAWPYRWVIARV